MTVLLARLRYAARPDVGLVYWWTGLDRIGQHAPCDAYSFRHVHLPLGLVWWRDR